jgi:HD-like signal output (HDOD) protein/prolyl-tRNA editing enzyme YbaK/EbsC (Cys-tRNA(Pro) deacylase)
MSTSITVRRHLEKQDVRYSTVGFHGDVAALFEQGRDDVRTSQIARATILKDHNGLVMAIHQADHHIDLSAINQQIHRDLKMASDADFHGVFADCSPGVIPPLGEAYGFETVIDKSLLNNDFIYFLSGNNRELIRVTAQDFQLLHNNAWLGNTSADFVQPRNSEQPLAEAQPEYALTGLRERIERTTELPPMPTMAQQIIQLNANPYAHADDLARLVERDPSLSAQVVRYAQSPFYGYSGTVASVRQAISRVLGYDMVMNIALGIAAIRPFKVQPHGPLGMFAFWRHATYNAALCQALCSQAKAKMRPRPGTAYLCGLLHDMGFLLLGHFFPKEFEQLNAAVAHDPETPVMEHEKRLFGITHTEIGNWLMQAWDMPAEIIVAMREHHNTSYSGAHEEYVLLTQIADRMLRHFDTSDADSGELPDWALEKLGLTEESANAILDKVLAGRDGLDAMIQQLVA